MASALNQKNSVFHGPSFLTYCRINAFTQGSLFGERRYWILIFAALLCEWNPVVAADSAPAPLTTGQRVFTAGNSFHAWYIAPILQDLADRAGIKGHVIVGVSKIGGSRAIQHWEIPDAQNEAKAALGAGKVDVLTLACMLQPDEGIDKFAELALAHNANARVVLQEF